MPIPLEEIVLGVYLGLLTGVFPAFIAFSLAFSFKYFTNVTVPGLGVVALAGALAGISGGLMGILDPELAESWTGIIAIVVILMASLWAHAVGDTLAMNTPRRLTLQSLRERRLPDLVERVDAYGHFRVRPIGEIQDIPGYPPLGAELRAEIATATWRFPGDLPIPTLEERLTDRLLDEYELAEVEVSIDRRGRARIAVAPIAAGLSRRLPDGHRAVTVDTVLPTGVARQDEISLLLPDGTVTGPVVSARTAATAAEPLPLPVEPDPADTDDTGEIEPEPVRAPTTDGGPGRVTIAVPPETAIRVLERSFAPMYVHPRGHQRAFELVAVLKRGGHRFRRVHVGSGTDGAPIAEMTKAVSGEIAVLALERGAETQLVPDPQRLVRSGDRLIVRGTRADLRAFQEGMA